MNDQKTDDELGYRVLVTLPEQYDQTFLLGILTGHFHQVTTSPEEHVDGVHWATQVWRASCGKDIYTTPECGHQNTLQILQDSKLVEDDQQVLVSSDEYPLEELLAEDGDLIRLVSVATLLTGKPVYVTAGQQAQRPGQGNLVAEKDQAVMSILQRTGGDEDAAFVNAQGLAIAPDTTVRAKDAPLRVIVHQICPESLASTTTLYGPLRHRGWQVGDLSTHQSRAMAELARRMNEVNIDEHTRWMNNTDGDLTEVDTFDLLVGVVDNWCGGMSMSRTAIRHSAG